MPGDYRINTQELLDSLLPEGRHDFVDSNGRYRTQSLFFDKRVDGHNAYFTFSRRDRLDPEGNIAYISLYKIYMGMTDPTEYQFAMAVFDSWDQWMKIANNKLLSKSLGIPKWRDELQVKIRSLGITANIDAALEGDTSSAKWLAEHKWKGKRKAGAPTKAERAQSDSIDRAIDAETNDELTRLGIH